MPDEKLPDDPANVIPDAVTAHLSRGALKDAHGRTGRMMKNAGLPFEPEEFEGDGEDAVAKPDDGSASSSQE